MRNYSYKLNWYYEYNIQGSSNIQRSYPNIHYILCSAISRNLHLFWPTKTPKWSVMTNDRHYLQRCFRGFFCWFFRNFDFLCWGKKAKNCLKWKTAITSVMRHISRKVAYNHDFWYTCVKWWYLQEFFFFFHFFFWNFHFSICLECKRAKNSPKWKITITSVSTVSQEQYSIWSWVLVHLCKMMISPGFFFSFLKFYFFGLFVG